MRKPAGFTLIELLVVVAIIALLVAVLLPSLGRSRQQSKKTFCGAHLHALAGALQMYVQDNHGWTHRSPNNGLWDNAWQNSANFHRYGPNDPNAYWGIAYYPYSKNKNIWSCPTAVRVDDWPENGWGISFQKYFQFCSYGLNGIIANSHNDAERTSAYQAGMRLDSDFDRPATTIAFQDHIEQRLEVPVGATDSDCFCITPSQGTNLTQWRLGFRRTEFPNAVNECFRHLDRSNTAWLDGHISDIRKTSGRDVPATWYTGGRKVP